jgi:integrase
MSDTNGFKLSAVKVARLKKPGRYGDGHGLYLRVAEYPDRDGKPKRSRNWVFRYEIAGRERWMGLGPLHSVTLAEARAYARECRALLVQGLDPIEARAAKRRGTRLAAARAVTFKQIAERYIKSHSAGWKNAAHRAQWPSTMASYVYPVIGNVAVGDVDTGMIMKILEPIWSDKPETGSRVRGRIERVLDAAKAQGLRSGENPARWKGHLKNLLPARDKVQRKGHHPAMPDADMPAFMAAIRARKEISAKALEFTILTASRTNEAIRARWSEIDLDAKLWTVPPDRMKSGRPHIVPLSDRAVAILKSLDRIAGCPFVFPGAKHGQPLSNMAMLELLRGMRPGYVVHGFRSTFRDWCGDRTNYPRDVIEAALAHQIKDKTEAAYRRRTAVEKRRRLMADWSHYLSTTGRPTAGRGKVVVLHGR